MVFPLERTEATHVPCRSGAMAANGSWGGVKGRCQRTGVYPWLRGVWKHRIEKNCAIDPENRRRIDAGICLPMYLIRFTEIESISPAYLTKIFELQKDGSV